MPKTSALDHSATPPTIVVTHTSNPTLNNTTQTQNINNIPKHLFLNINIPFHHRPNTRDYSGQHNTQHTIYTHVHMHRHMHRHRHYQHRTRPVSQKNWWKRSPPHSLTQSSNQSTNHPISQSSTHSSPCESSYYCRTR